MKKLIISICILFLIGCTVDLEEGTKRDLEEIHTDCLKLEDDLADLQATLDLLMGIIEFYAYQEYDGGLRAREVLEE